MLARSFGLVAVQTLHIGTKTRIGNEFVLGRPFLAEVETAVLGVQRGVPKILGRGRLCVRVKNRLDKCVRSEPDYLRLLC